MENKKNKKKKRTARAKQSSGAVFAALYGAAVGGILVLALSLVCSLICLSAQNPDTLLSPLSFAVSGVSFIICGFIASRRARAILPSSLLSGAILTAFLWIVSLFLSDSDASGTSLVVSLLIRVVFVAVSLLGGMIGVNTGNKKRKRRTRGCRS